MLSIQQGDRTTPPKSRGGTKKNFYHAVGKDISSLPTEDSHNIIIIIQCQSQVVTMYRLNASSGQCQHFAKGQSQINYSQGMHNGRLL